MRFPFFSHTTICPVRLSALGSVESGRFLFCSPLIFGKPSIGQEPTCPIRHCLVEVLNQVIVRALGVAAHGLELWRLASLTITPPHIQRRLAIPLATSDLEHPRARSYIKPTPPQLRRTHAPHTDNLTCSRRTPPRTTRVMGRQQCLCSNPTRPKHSKQRKQCLEEASPMRYLPKRKSSMSL